MSCETRRAPGAMMLLRCESVKIYIFNKNGIDRLPMCVFITRGGDNETAGCI